MRAARCRSRSLHGAISIVQPDPVELQPLERARLDPADLEAGNRPPEHEADGGREAVDRALLVPHPAGIVDELDAKLARDLAEEFYHANPGIEVEIGSPEQKRAGNLVEALGGILVGARIARRRGVAGRVSEPRRVDRQVWLVHASPVNGARKKFSRPQLPAAIGGDLAGRGGSPIMDAMAADAIKAINEYLARSRDVLQAAIDDEGCGRAI